MVQVVRVLSLAAAVFVLVDGQRMGVAQEMAQAPAVPAQLGARAVPPFSEAPAPPPTEAEARMKCQQLERANLRGQKKYMRDPEVQYWVKLCAAMKSASGRAQPSHAPSRPSVPAVMNKLAGKSLAVGCTALLKAKDDGKMEWFESQGWYKKAMEMCTTLSGTSPMELEERIQGSRPVDLEGRAPDKIVKLAESFGALQGASSIDMLKGTCSKLALTPADHPVRQKSWFGKAENMCATVQSSSPDELRDLIQRQQHSAETASGQLVKQTCSKMQKDQRMGETKHFEEEPWFAELSKMCAKMGQKKVRFANLEKRCQWLEKIKGRGEEKAFQAQVWFSRLQSACQWGKDGKKHKKAPEQEGGTTVLV